MADTPLTGQLYQTAEDTLSIVANQTFTDCSNGNIHKLDLTDDTTLEAPTNPQLAVHIWEITQDSTGGHTLTLDPIFVGADTFDTTLATTTIITGYYNGFTWVVSTRSGLSLPTPLAELGTESASDSHYEMTISWTGSDPTMLFDSGAVTWLKGETKILHDAVAPTDNRDFGFTMGGFKFSLQNGTTTSSRTLDASILIQTGTGATSTARASFFASSSGQSANNVISHVPVDTPFELLTMTTGFIKYDFTSDYRNLGEVTVSWEKKASLT